MWTFDYGGLLKCFRLAARDIGAPGLAPCQARHSGPSVDRCGQAPEDTGRHQETGAAAQRQERPAPRAARAARQRA
eukprot:9271015-Pyramimonas_sp.AAC.1